MRKIFSVLVAGLSVSLVVIGFLSGFFASLAMGETCPDEVRGFDDSEVYVEGFSVENESGLVLDVVNDGRESVEVREIRLFFFTPGSEKKISLEETIESGSSSQIEVGLDESNNCNDIPIELDYRASTGTRTSVGSVSAHLE